MKLKSILAGAAAAVLASTAALSAHAANLLTNGSFETGDLTGWSTVGDFSFSGVANGSFFGLNPADGDFQVYLGSVASTGGITQTFSDTAGQLLHVTGAYAGDGGPPSSLEISFDGVDIINMNPGPSDNTYHTFSADFVGTGSDTLTITSLQAPAYNLVDNFSVTAVPEPATWAMLLLGFGGLGAALRARRRASAMFAA
jgi:hypothetical protein